MVESDYWRLDFSLWTQTEDVAKDRARRKELPCSLRGQVFFSPVALTSTPVANLSLCG